MTKILPPNLTANADETADWMELNALVQERYSKSDMSSLFAVQGSDDVLFDVDDDPHHDDDIENFVDDALSEITRRAQWANEAYPFELHGDVLRTKKDLASSLVYRFMLALTLRAHADVVQPKGKKQNNARKKIQPTKLFEHVAQQAVVQYLGANDRVRSYHFGFPRPDGTGFAAALEDLCSLVNDFAQVRRDNSMSHYKDSGLDVVSWVEFSDELPGKLIVFGQCATGRSDLKAKLHDLQPQSFTAMWLAPSFGVDPLRMFFVPFQYPNHEREHAIRNAGVLFDRCRISSLVSQAALPAHVTTDIERWTQDAYRDVQV